MGCEATFIGQTPEHSVSLPASFHLGLPAWGPRKAAAGCFPRHEHDSLRRRRTRLPLSGSPPRRHFRLVVEALGAALPWRCACGAARLPPVVIQGRIPPRHALSGPVSPRSACAAQVEMGPWRNLPSRKTSCTCASVSGRHWLAGRSCGYSGCGRFPAEAVSRCQRPYKPRRSPGRAASVPGQGSPGRSSHTQQCLPNGGHSQVQGKQFATGRIRGVQNQFLVVAAPVSGLHPRKPGRARHPLSTLSQEPLCGAMYAVKRISVEKLALMHFVSRSRLL